MIHLCFHKNFYTFIVISKYLFFNCYEAIISILIAVCKPYAYDGFKTLINAKAEVAAIICADRQLA
jgi:hypothetical protein